MPSNISSLFDPGALAIVVAGTVLATVARSGWRDFGKALRAAGGMVVRRGFNSDANRRALALALGAIQRDGTHRADPVLPPDRALGLMLETYLRHGTIEAVGNARAAQRARDEAERIGAAQVFAWAGDLAPVFGLVGTLYGLTQLAANGTVNTTATIMGAVSTAVLTSLYGALLAHLLCHPMASAIERRGLADEEAREALADWFIAQTERGGGSPQDRRPHLRGVA